MPISPPDPDHFEKNLPARINNESSFFKYKIYLFTVISVKNKVRFIFFNFAVN